MSYFSFNISDNEVRDAAVKLLAQKAIDNMGYSSVKELTDKIKAQVEALDTAEISKQATAFLIAKVMGNL